MTPTLTRWLAAATAAGALAAAACWTDGPEAAAQPANGPTEGGSPRVANCRRCHGSPLPEDKANGVTDFVMLTESQVWHDEDLHALAHVNIVPGETGGKPNLAKQMQDVLANSPPRKGRDYHVAQAAECLACHAVDLSVGRKPLAEKTADDFDPKSGVSCEACHGLADDWIGPHFVAKWRQVPPSEKSDKYHQVDLRDPYVRAGKCASCHVGNKAEGKFVTHEMYAAGHPPLPPFEVVTFAHDAPRHYYTHRENKALAAMPAEAAWKNFHFRTPADKEHPEGECPEARAFALGTVAGFDATMKLLADDAADTPKDQLLDFAHFDCYACHHDLKVPSWRQKRGYRGVPGRPTMKPWSTETLRAVMDHAKAATGFKTEEATKAADQVRQGLEALNKQFDARPFGDAAEIAKQAKEFGPQCQALRTVLNDDAAVYTPAQTEALYRVLAERLQQAAGAKAGTDGLYLDHDAAQQAVWGLRVLGRELRLAKGQTVSDDSLSPAEAALNDITELRVRPTKRVPVAGPRLETRLKHIAAFDPDVFLPKAREWLKGQP
jgi:hypothetical protein